MAGLYDRVQSRGFPSSVVAGQTGAGALESQGSALDPQDLTLSDPSAYTTLPGYEPEPVAGLDIPLLEGTWGISGAGTNPDRTPRTHAAPSPGWAGSYDDPELLTVRENSARIHSVDFGALAPRMHSSAAIAEPELDIWSSNDPGENVLQPLSGQIRAMGGYDTTQGYDLRNRYGFDAGHRERLTASDPQPMSYLDPAERPFVVPQASGSFTPTDAYWGPEPYATYLDAGNLNATDPTAYQVPAAPTTAPAPPSGGPVGAGWWR